MYNRYVPAGDGTYRRQIIEEKNQNESPVSRPQPVPTQEEHRKPECRPPQKPVSKASTQPLTSLLANIDKGDLILLLILVLLLIDEEKENSTLLLTIALYFLMQ